MAYQFMREHHTIRGMTGLFGMSCGACYQWTRHGVSDRRRRADTELVDLIREVVPRHHRRYGSLWGREELRREYGKRVSRKKVARVMRENGLNARLRRSFVRITWSDHGLGVCENLPAQDFQAGMADRRLGVEHEYGDRITFPR
jgi:transposase InsO family protein